MLYRRVVCWGGALVALLAPVLAVAANAAPSPPASNIQTVKLAPTLSREEVLIRQYLYEADDALAHERLMSPRHDNAYDGYHRVLAIDPQNERARTGLKHISRRYLSLAKRAQAQGDYEKALGYARQAQRVAPGYEGSAHMVKFLEQEFAKQQKTEMAQVKAGVAARPVVLNVKGNEYLLAARDVSARNLTIKMQLVEIAKKVKELDSRVLIVARNDSDGRWIYAQMREALVDYRLRGNIKTDEQTRVVLLDQSASPATAQNTP